MNSDDRFSLPCLECGETESSHPEPLDDDTFVTCSKCGFSAPFIDIKTYGQAKARDHLERLAKDSMCLLNLWDGLTAHLRDGRIPIDKNDCEQLMKQVALGRKNWLFTGGVRAGYHSADLMRICRSAIRNNLDVFAYVKDALDQLIAGSTDYDSLRPDVLEKSHPESVRDYRIDEKRERGARRDRQRLERRLAKLSR